MKPELLAQMLVDADLGAIGETIFVHHMPEITDRGVCVRLPLTGVKINHELPNYYKGRVQIIVRAPDQADGDDLAMAVIRALTIAQETDINDPDTGEWAMRVKYLRADSLPIVFPRSLGNLKEWSINFDCCYVAAII